MQAPLFSIIIPALNSANTIAATLSSALGQRTVTLEVIVVDGASSDDTVGIVQKYEYEDSRISLISEPDSGLYDAMNKGIALSRGQWLMFLGADDSLFKEDVLEGVAKVIQRDMDTRFIYGDVCIGPGRFQLYRGYDYFQLLKKCICHQAIIYHRSLFKEFQYDTQFSICADWDFNLRVFRKKNRPIYIGRTIANFGLTGRSSNWRQHPEYLAYFADPRKLIKRYRNGIYLLYYDLSRTLKILRRMLTADLPFAKSKIED